MAGAAGAEAAKGRLTVVIRHRPRGVYSALSSSAPMTMVAGVRLDPDEDQAGLLPPRSARPRETQRCRTESIETSISSLFGSRRNIGICEERPESRQQACL